MTTFLLAFTALFSIVNPLTGAFIFFGATQELSPKERISAARWVSLYAAILVAASLYVGAYVLGFFGITLPALQVAGGIIISLSGWGMLTGPDTADRRRNEASGGIPAHHIISRLSFYPLTMPLTVGPGTISVAISVGANRPNGVTADALAFIIETMLAVLALGACVYVAYRHSEWLARAMGPTGTAIVVRLSAFLLFCIGIQIGWNGLYQLLGTLPFAVPTTLP